MPKLDYEIENFKNPQKTLPNSTVIVGTKFKNQLKESKKPDKQLDKIIDRINNIELKVRHSTKGETSLVKIYDGKMNTTSNIRNKSII